MNKPLIIGGGLLAVLFLMFGKQAKAAPVTDNAFGNAVNGTSPETPTTPTSGVDLMKSITQGQNLTSGITEGLSELALFGAAFSFITTLTKPLLLSSASRANVNDPKAAYEIMDKSGIPKNYRLAFVNASEAYANLNIPLWDAYRSLGDYANSDGTFSLPPVYLQRGSVARTIWERVPKDGVKPGDGWEVAVLPDGREFDNKGKEVTANAWVMSIIS
jgi:hypothetical protein